MKEKKFIISESMLMLLMEQVRLQPNMTAKFIESAVNSNIKPYEEEVKDGKEAKK